MDENKPLLTPKVISVPVEDKTPEEIETKAKFFRIMERVAFVVVIMAVFSVCLLVLDKQERKSIIQKTSIALLTESKAEAVSKVVALTEENKVLEEKLADIKDMEGLAKRDLEMYILQKYRVIPKVVAHEIAVQTVEITKEEGVPFSVLVGLIEVESQFKPWAVSKKEARGLTQVMPFWVKKKEALGMEIGSKYDLHDVSIGIRAGIRVLKIHLKEANNDINQGLYLYVGKDSSYANKVFNAMGRFEVFRSTLDTTLRDEEIKEIVLLEEKVVLE